jgi:hypothetical protein
MSNKTPKSGENGKGGNFDTRRNPFSDKPGKKGGAPELASEASIGGTIDAVLRAGCALMLGHTRDGGALVITVLDGDDRHRTYCSNDEELDAAVRALANMYGK